MPKTNKPQKRLAGETIARVGSGNVFADLGHPQPEQALTKAKLAHAICACIEAAGLTQAQAAERLGIDQPKVSALSRGRLAQFSIDRLLRFLINLDADVEINIKPHRGSGSAAIRVIEEELLPA